jgi:nucleoside-diphosphate-sugar epimerase
MTNRVVSILGCGWLGKALGKSLVDSGFQVMGSTTKKDKIEPLESVGIMPFVFNVGELSRFTDAQKFFNTDVLIISLPQRARIDNGRAYVDQIKSVIALAKQCKLNRMLLISTTSVYPNLNRVVTEEDADPQNPIVKAELMVLESGIPSTVLRFAGLFGPDRHPGRFLAGKHDVVGADVPVNMIHLDDCVEIITRLIKNDLWNKVLNACADEHPTKKDFYTQSAISIGVEPPSFVAGMSEFKIVSNKRIKEMLNYKFIHSLV